MVTADEIKQDVQSMINAWTMRNVKFKEWYNILNLEDKLKKDGMESAVSNDPRTFFNLAKYLMTAGKVRHMIPIGIESGIEMDRQSRCERACDSMWYELNSQRRRMGRPSFIEELVFDLLFFGWYNVIGVTNSDGSLTTEIWPPPTVYPRYEDREMAAVVHRYKVSAKTVKAKAEALHWSLEGVSLPNLGYATVDNYFFRDNGSWKNMVLVDMKPVTGVEERDNVILLVSPVGGFPDMGEIEDTGGTQWTERFGQSVLASNATVYDTTNRWMTFMMQLLRDTAEPKYKEISNQQKIKPEQIYKRGAVFHMVPGEDFQAVAVPPIPMEMIQVLNTLNVQKQKGSISDVLFGIVQQHGMSGYAFSQLMSSANMILGDVQEAKHFVIQELDRHWLQNLKSTKRVYVIKGKASVEKLKPTDIPSDVSVMVDSELATPKDWMERGVVAGYMKDFLDKTTIMEDILKVPDTQLVKRRKIEDMAVEHPMAQNLHLAIGLNWMAKYMTQAGYPDVGDMMAKASAALEQQFGLAPPGGQGNPAAGPPTPGTPEKISVPPQIQPSQARVEMPRGV